MLEGPQNNTNNISQLNNVPQLFMSSSNFVQNILVKAPFVAMSSDLILGLMNGLDRIAGRIIRQVIISFSTAQK